MKCEIKSFSDGVLFFNCPECDIDLERDEKMVAEIWSNHLGNSICPACHAIFNMPSVNEVDALKSSKKSFWQYPLLWLFISMSLLTGAVIGPGISERVESPSFYLVLIGGILLIGFVSALFIYSLFIHPIYQAFWMEEELKKREPSSKPFKWGFYVGVSAKRLGIFYTIILLLGGLGMMIGVGADFSEGNNEMAVVWAVSGVVYLLVGIYTGFVAVAGHFVIKRKKWALIVMTVLSGPIGWLINGIYISNRWDEFGSESKTDSLPPPSIPGKVCPYCDETIKMDAKKCRYCHEWL